MLDIAEQEQSAIDEDPVLRRQKKEMKQMIHEERASFNFATLDIIKSLLCCMAYCPIKWLRRH